MKLKHLFTAALATLMLGACSNEELVQQTDGSLYGNIPEGKVEYQFNITGVTPTHLSYAPTSVNMEKDEMVMKDATALVFGQTNETDITNDTDRLIAIVKGNIKGETKMSFLLDKNVKFAADVKKLAFVVVANQTGCTLRDDITAGTIKPCTTTTAGDVITVNADGTTYADLLTTLKSKGEAGANKATNGLLMTATVKNQDVPQPGDGLKMSDEARFRRPFARFDIKNKGMKSLKITGLKVKNLMAGWLILGGKEPVGTGSDLTITIPTIPTDLNRPADGSKPGAAEFVPCVFYTYPTSETENPTLIINGTLSTPDGVETLVDYEVPFRQTYNKVSLEENTRYKLTITVDENGDVISEFDTAVEAWGDGGDQEYILDDYTGVVKMDANLGQNGPFSFISMTPGVNTYHLIMMTSDPDAVTSNYTGTVISKVEVVDPVTYADPAPANAKVYDYTITVPAGVVALGGTFTLTFAGDMTLSFLQPADPTFVAPEDKYTIINKESGDLLNLDYITATGDVTPAIYWAPVNVGASSADEPGRVFQKGRSYVSWPDVATALATAHNGQVSLNEAFHQYRDQYIVHPSSPMDWFTDSSDGSSNDFNNMIKDWREPSLDLSNPCPKGWRLPSFEEIEALGTFGAATPAGDGKLTREASGVTFLVYERLEETSGGSRVEGESGYLYYRKVDSYEHLLTYQISATTAHGGSSSSGGYIRCVKDVPVAPIP